MMGCFLQFPHFGIHVRAIFDNLFLGLLADKNFSPGSEKENNEKGACLACG